VRLTKVLVACAVLAASFAASALAATPKPLEDGTLSVRDGRATIQLRMRGTIIGRLGRGKLVVTDSANGATIVVRGAEDRDVFGRTITYTGMNIRFRVADEKRFGVKVAGKGLNFSAVGRGDGWMDGWGDPAGGVFFDGSYSLNGVDYPSLPNERTRFDLAAPPGD
jgi:hypothetical protein